MINHEVINVAAGVCTCNRPKMLAACLDSLAAQILPLGVFLHIVVADNEPEPNNAQAVARFAAGSPYPVHYVHQPRRGIATARNAILDKALELQAHWIAMLDDDETADRRWIANLIVEEYWHLPILMGRRIWTYPEPRPFWAPEKEPKLTREGAPTLRFSTSNVRFSIALPSAGLRFDETMGLAGGSDQRFFRDAAKRGFAIHATNRALTYEAAHPERLTYRFMIARHYAHAASLTSHDIRDRGTSTLLREVPKRLLGLPLGVIELAISPLAGLFGRRLFKKFALRGGKRIAHSTGMLAASLGHLPQPYRRVVGQ